MVIDTESGQLFSDSTTSFDSHFTGHENIVVDAASIEIIRNAESVPRHWLRHRFRSCGKM